MACENGRKKWHQAAAVACLLSTLASCLQGFEFGRLATEAGQGNAGSEVAEMGFRKGRILYDGRDFSSRSQTDALVAKQNGSLLHLGFSQANDSGKQAEVVTSRVDAVPNEVAWRRMAHSLQCGGNQLTLRVKGRGVSRFQLDMGNAPPLPLNQLPPACGYSAHWKALGLVLVVPYSGCNVKEEDGSYVLRMRWHDTPVTLICPILASPTAASSSLTIPKPVLKPSSHEKVYRTKRQANYNPGSGPAFPFSYMYYPYHLPVPTPGPTPNPTTAPATKPVKGPHDLLSYLAYLKYYYSYFYPIPTSKPPVTAESTTAKPGSTTKKPQIPVYPFYHFYPFYPYFPYYPLATTGPPTTKPTATDMTTTTTTTTPPTTKTPHKPPVWPPRPYYPPYFPYYPYPIQPPPTIPLPDGSVYYYPIIQNFYGHPPQSTASPVQTKTTATTTAKPGCSTGGSTTAKAGCTQATTKPSSTAVPHPPGQVNPYIPYHQLPFNPYVSHNTHFSPYDDPKYFPHASYKFGLPDHRPPFAHPYSPGDPSLFDWQELIKKYWHSK